MTDIYGLTYEKLKAMLSDMGEKPSRADILLPAVYAEPPCAIAGLPLKKETLEKLSGNFYTGELECISVLTSGTADKYLFALNDGSNVESVLMKHEFGYNVCVSTQVGCNMGCAFCMSGKLKKRRDLTVSEMVGQLLAIRRTSGKKITGISIMGIGEPLENLANVLDFIEIMMYPKGFDIGIKHITLSTCGIVPGIYELADSRTPVNLAISLHAPYDGLREKLMPVTHRYSISEVIGAARYYSEKNNRRITFEYVMLNGINDTDDCAQRLSELLHGMNCYVNLIRYNSNEGCDFSCSPHERIMGFYDVLKKNGTGVTMRRELGASVNAACGQLAARQASPL